MQHKLVVAAVTVGVFVGTPTAEARPIALSAGMVGSATSASIYADGRRFASASVTPTSAVIFDDGPTGPRVTAFPCPLTAASGGRALARCGETDTVVDLASKVQHPIAGVQPGDYLGTDVGATWINGSTTDATDATTRTLYLNWHTGARDLQAFPIDGTYDLDQSPLSRKPLARGDLLLGVDDSRYAIHQGVRRVALRRRSRTIAIRRGCPGPLGCSLVQYAAGIVSWAEGDGACAYAVATRRTGCWRPTAAQNRHILIGSDLAPTHTTRALYITAQAPAGGYVTFRAPLRAVTHERSHIHPMGRGGFEPPSDGL